MTETNAERLENMSPIGVDQVGNLLVKQEDWFWLSEQVEWVTELEKGIKDAEFFLNTGNQLIEQQEETSGYAKLLNKR